MTSGIPLTIVMGNTLELEEIDLNTYIYIYTNINDGFTGKVTHLETPLISSRHILSIHPLFISGCRDSRSWREHHRNHSDIKYQQGEWTQQHSMQMYLHKDPFTRSCFILLHTSSCLRDHFEGLSSTILVSFFSRPEADRASYQRTAWWETRFPFTWSNTHSRHFDRKRGEESSVELYICSDLAMSPWLGRDDRSCRKAPAKLG